MLPSPDVKDLAFQNLTRVAWEGEEKLGKTALKTGRQEVSKHPTLRCSESIHFGLEAGGRMLQHRNTGTQRPQLEGQMNLRTILDLSVKAWRLSVRASGERVASNLVRFGAGIRTKSMVGLRRKRERTGARL